MSSGGKYIVIYPFKDLKKRTGKQASGRIYAAGDVYLDLDEQEKRINELMGSDNKIGRPLIKKEGQEETALTKKEIMEQLDNKNIDYNKRDNKQTLYDLLGSD